jgi:hypothetical protein
VTPNSRAASEDVPAPVFDPPARRAAGGAFDPSHPRFAALFRRLDELSAAGREV